MHSAGVSAIALLGPFASARVVQVDHSLWLIFVHSSRSLITNCRVYFVWWTVGGELGGGVFGFPSLSFGDGMQEQQGPGWDVGVCGCRTFPEIGPVLGTISGSDAGIVQPPGVSTWTPASGLLAASLSTRRDTRFPTLPVMRATLARGAVDMLFRRRQPQTV
jgi:hypothetical protein